jgi:hypothetical protein
MKNTISLFRCTPRSPTCSIVFDMYFLKYILPQIKLAKHDIHVCHTQLPGFPSARVCERCIRCNKYHGLLNKCC